MGDSLVVNDFAEVPVTVGEDGVSVAVKMNKRLSSFLWDTGIVTSWLTWWYAVFELTFDPRLGVLVFHQSDDINLVFSQDACKTERPATLSLLARSPAASYLPPVGSFCGVLSTKRRDETVILFEEGSMLFSTDQARVPFGMDGTMIIFDTTHPGYLEFLARWGLGRPANHLFTYSKGKVRAEIGDTKVFLRPCGSTAVDPPQGSFCYKLSAMSTLTFEFTSSQDIRFSVSSPLSLKTFPRTAEYTLTEFGGISVDINSPAVSALTRHLQWTSFKLVGFTRASISVDIGRVITLSRC